MDKPMPVIFGCYPLEHFPAQCFYWILKILPELLLMRLEPSLVIIQPEVPHKINCAGRKAAKHFNHPLLQ
jgi:hypothetical protein